MGSWGERSCDNDNVQNILDKHFNPCIHDAYAAARVNRVLGKIKSDFYDPTAFVGVVCGVLEMCTEIDSEHIMRALGEALKALNSKEYLKDWKSPALRKAELLLEVKELAVYLKKHPISTKLTAEEVKYIKQMFCEEKYLKPILKGLTDIRELPLGCLGLFIENKDEEPMNEEWVNDRHITLRYLTAHKLPLNTTFAEWEKWLLKQPKKLR